MSGEPETPRVRFTLWHTCVAVTGLCVVCAVATRNNHYRDGIGALGSLFATVLLILGTITLCTLRWRRRARMSVLWLPLISFFVAPLLSLGYWALDLFWLSREHHSIYWMNRYDALLPALELGIRVGVVVAVVFGTGTLASAGLEIARSTSNDLDTRVVISLALFAAPIIVALVLAAVLYLL